MADEASFGDVDDLITAAIGEVRQRQTRWPEVQRHLSRALSAMQRGCTPRPSTRRRLRRVFEVEKATAFEDVSEAIWKTSTKTYRRET